MIYTARQFNFLRAILLGGRLPEGKVDPPGVLNLVKTHPARRMTDGAVDCMFAVVEFLLAPNHFRALVFAACYGMVELSIMLDDNRERYREVSDGHPLSDYAALMLLSSRALTDT